MEELVKTLQKQVEDLTETNDRMALENAELKAKLAVCTCGGEAGKKELANVTVDGKEYKYTGPAGFVLGGHGYTAEEALADVAVLKAVLELPGQSYLQELV